MVVLLQNSWVQIRLFTIVYTKSCIVHFLLVSSPFDGLVALSLAFLPFCKREHLLLGHLPRCLPTRPVSWLPCRAVRRAPCAAAAAAATAMSLFGLAARTKASSRLLAFCSARSPGQEDLGQEAEAEPADPAVDPLPDWQHRECHERRPCPCRCRGARQCARERGRQPLPNRKRASSSSPGMRSGSAGLPLNSASFAQIRYNSKRRHWRRTKLGL